jgi:hypothetical protein
MMDSPSESPYRHARRAFIAACDHAHVDAIARLHPAKSPDGKPLFMDAAALGPRHAARAVLVVAHGAAGAALLTALPDTPLPPGTRLVLVHALDPAAFAGVAGDPAWPPAMLGAVATEDLAKVRDLAVICLDGGGARLLPVLREHLPDAKITLLPAPGNIAALRYTIATWTQPVP